MAFPTAPLNPQDPFAAAQQFLSGGSNGSGGFQAQSLASPSGFGGQNAPPNGRAASNARNIVHWMVPEQPIVQMYINPQNITYGYTKSITPQRTKGGFLLQYWGANLTTLRLTGTTGTSGIEGINVLEGVYNNEQSSLDPYALFLAASNDANLINGGAVATGIGSAFGGGNVANTIGGAVGGLLQAGSQLQDPNATRPRPSLAQLAFTVEMYWSGEVYRGFFTAFNVTESADNLGMFNYEMDFTVTQKRGSRQNFLAWHRSAVSGPSNSDPNFGTPYSFGSLVQGDQPTPQQSTSSGSGILQSISNSLGF